MDNFGRLGSVIFAVGLVASTASGQDDWLQFRGPRSAGVAEEAKLAFPWSSTENVVWKTEVPGRGWSSPIVCGQRVFITSAVGEKPSATPRLGICAQNMRGQSADEQFCFMVYCLDWKTGKILWEKTAWQGRPQVAIHAKNSYATATPVADGERVIVCFGAVGLFAYDLDGRELWSHPWPAFRTRYGWGPAASPVLFQDRVYMVNDNEESSSLLALDKRTGKQIWQVPRDEKTNWSTPLIWSNALRNEIVTAGSGKVRSYDLDGHLLWELSGMSPVNIPTPVATQDLLYLASGYVTSLFRPVYAIRPGASGDISLPGDATSSRDVAFCLPLAGPYNPSPLVYRGHLYLLYDRGSLACYDAHTGKEIYGRQRLSTNLATFAASPWACDGKIYCLSEEGETFVIQAGTLFKVVLRNRLDEAALASPAVVRDNLVVRTLSKVYRIGRKD